MSTRALEDICEKLCRELDEIAKKPELGAGDLDIVHKLTDTMKNIYKIEMYEEDGGYSRAGEWEADMRGRYGRGNSYAHRGQHYVRGHYSRTDARERMRSQMEDMIRDADDDRTREAIRRCMNELDS
mgnify:FL=1